EVLDVDIGAPDERIEYLGILRALDVQCDAALVPVIGLEMRAVEPALERAERIARARLLDLDDVRAQVGQQHPRGRTGDEGALFDDGDAFQHLGARLAGAGLLDLHGGLLDAAPARRPRGSLAT